MTTLASSINYPFERQQKNFWHLYWDIAGFGLLQGSTLAFLIVFITRLEATAWQIGLLTAGPAVINILLTLPAGEWLAGKELGRLVTITAFWFRLGYFVLIPLPLLFSSTIQIWLIVIIILVSSIPGVVLAIGFNGLLAAAVPPVARGMVVGRRNALLAGTTMLAFFLSGWILDNWTFEWGYVVVFTLGALGSGLSTYHLWCIQVPRGSQFQIRPLGDRARPGRPLNFIETVNIRQTISSRLWLIWQPNSTKFLHKISARYWWAMWAFFLFHFTQMMLVPILPIFFVRELNLTDGEISWLNMIFYLVVFLVSPFLEALTKQFGNYRLAAGGGVLLAVYPLINAFSSSFMALAIANILVGLVWAVLGGALMNRLLELAPDDDRAIHLAIYNLSLNVAIALSAMLGSLLVEWFEVRQVLFLIFVLRVGSGLALFRWG